MSLRSKSLLCRYGLPLLATLAVATLTSIARGQEQPPVPKWEIFAGYSWLDPRGSINGVPLRSMPWGWGASVTRDVSKSVGLTADFGGHYSKSTNSATSINSSMHTAMFGPKLTYRTEHFAPFIEGLAGLNALNPSGFPEHNGIGLALGGGIDMIVHRNLAIRLIQADYMYAHHHFIPKNLTNLDGARLQGGIVWLINGPSQEGPAPAASCSLEPREVMAGEPVKVTASASNFPRKSTLSYSWSSTGGKISGTAETVTVDTTGLAGGSYNVTAKVTDNKKSNAECTSSFTVKEQPKNSPTISCSANPTTVRSGESSTVTCECKSPDGRQVSIANWTATSGRVSGTGNSATLDTAGVSPGSVTVGATCTDDRGLSSNGSAAVNVEAPPEKPQSSKLTEIPFKTNNARVNNDAKGALDGVADRLLQDPNARAVVVGETAPSERGGTRLAAQRAVNTKAYLTSGENQKAIDASRIEVRTGPGDQKAEIYIVPEGATFDQANTQPVDESKVKAQTRKAAPARPRRARSAKKKATTPTQ